MRLEDVKEVGDEIRFLRTNTRTFKFEIISEGATINGLWEYRVIGLFSILHCVFIGTDINGHIQ